MTNDPAENSTPTLFPEPVEHGRPGSLGLASGSAVRLSPKQKAVIEHCHICGKITLEAAVELIGRNIYCNAGKHVGAVLSTMVKRGLLVRVRPGVFILRGNNSFTADGWRNMSPDTQHALGQMVKLVLSSPNGD